jgi:hypothetical protein
VTCCSRGGAPPEEVATPPTLKTPTPPWWGLPDKTDNNLGQSVCSSRIRSQIHQRNPAVISKKDLMNDKCEPKTERRHGKCGQGDHSPLKFGYSPLQVFQLSLIRADHHHCSRPFGRARRQKSCAAFNKMIFLSCGASVHHSAQMVCRRGSA